MFNPQTQHTTEQAFAPTNAHDTSDEAYTAEALIARCGYANDFAPLIVQARAQLSAEQWTRVRAAHGDLDTPRAVARRLIAIAEAACFDWMVLPARYRGKYPIVQHNRALYPTRPSLDALIDLWLQHPGEHNAALMTGARSGGLIVADIDGRAGGTLHALVAAGWPTRTPIARSGSGGESAHVYARWPLATPVPNLSAYLEGIEIKGDGRLVITPPSVHATTGQFYHWLGGYAPWQLPLASLPEPVAQAILAQAEQAQSTRRAGGPMTTTAVAAGLTSEALRDWRDVGLTRRAALNRAERAYQRALASVQPGPSAAIASSRSMCLRDNSCRLACRSPT